MPAVSRRTCLETVSLATMGAYTVAGPGPAAASPISADEVTIKPEVAPDSALYDASDPDLREAASLIQEALRAENVSEEERLWTVIIDKYKTNKSDWMRDVVGRALGNRGNARSRQGKLDPALKDYNASIAMCPWSVDPVLNRGVVLEALGRFDEAVRDYRAVLAVAPDDPAGWNNLGNATAGRGQWAEAAQYYGRAASLAPAFSFASANRALALYEAGQANEAIREFRSLLRRYPDFPDMRAALAAALWAQGLEGEAESSWERVDDPRYRDRQWLRGSRRWPPSLVAALEAFLDIRSVPTT